MLLWLYYLSELVQLKPKQSTEFPLIEVEVLEVDKLIDQSLCLQEDLKFALREIC